MAASTAPAGALLSMSARDLLGFVRMHLTCTDFDAMRESQVEVPALATMNGHWALGWSLPDYGGAHVVGHTGRTAGQRAFLRVVPEAGIAVALLTNGGDVYPVFDEVFGHLLEELTGVTQPGLPVPPAVPQPVDAGRITGTYRSPLADNTLHVDADGRTWLRIAMHDDPIGADTLELVALGPDSLIAVRPAEGLHTVIGLIDDGAGRAGFLHTGRVIARVT